MARHRIAERPGFEAGGGGQVESGELMSFRARPLSEWAEAATPGSSRLFDVDGEGEWVAQFLNSGCALSLERGKVWIGWGEAVRAGRPSETRLSVFAPDFLLSDPRPWLVYESAAEVDAETLCRRLEALPEAERAFDWQGSDPTDFAAVFDDIQARIADGSLRKAVPVISRTAAGSLDAGARGRVLARALRVTLGFPMMAYGFWTPEGDGMIGATPEILFEQSVDGTLRTMALAGTRPTAADRQSLLSDPKELIEHRVVIDGIVDRLAPFGDVRVGETAELRLPALIHLHTAIEVAPARPVAFAEWVEALHPTPAIGAWPHAAGWEWLRAQPASAQRGRFGAPFGMIAPDGSANRCVVAIRNVQWTADETVLWAGCGIVGPSRLEREWGELNAKLDSIQGALGI